MPPCLLRILSALCLVIASGTAHAQPKVVTSIKPIHGLVSAIMAGVGEPAVIVEGAASPHNYNLKPSQAELLEEADVVFWIGHEMEMFLEKPVETIATQATVVSLIDAEGIVKLNSRHAGLLGEHKGEHKEGHENDDEHAHGVTDLHIWLDPQNARAMAATIAKTLTRADPKNAELYAANAAALDSGLEDLQNRIHQQIAPLTNRRFVVFHDAYQYFEKRFSVEASAVLTINPSVMPGVGRVSAVQESLRKLDAVCVFAEPQFPQRLVSVVTEGTSARTAVLDPLGAALEAGPKHYFQLIEGMAQSMAACLSKEK